MHAFDLETQQMLWTTGSMLPQCEQAMHLRSVTSNDRGLLFAVDEFNICVHMFSARDGRYCGCLIRADSPWGDRPLYVNWCENTSSLIVFHQKGREKKISFLEIPYLNQLLPECIYHHVTVHLCIVFPLFRDN